MLDDELPNYDISAYEKTLKLGPDPEPVAFCARQDYIEPGKHPISMSESLIVE